MSFVHLHVHSEYSLLEASCKVSSLVKKAGEFKMPALALTDQGNMFAAIEFYFAALGAGVKPIVGLDAFLAQNSRHQKTVEPTRKLTLLAQNYEGYQTLCKLSSIGYQEGFYYRPRLDYECLSQHNSNILVLSGANDGEIPQTFLAQGADAAIEKIKRLKNIFGDRFYLEILRPLIPIWNDINAFLLQAGRDLGIECVATNDVSYLEKDDRMAQEVLLCIGTNKTIHDESRPRLLSDQFWFKSSEQMQVLFSDIPHVLEKTNEIAERCHLKFKLKDDKGKTIYLLPSYPTQGGRSLQEELAILSRQGLEVRFQEKLARGESLPDKKIYYDRLEFELGVIDRMGFNGYFLIVQDFINWAKQNEIPVGPGRGSGAGSLVSFSVRITDLDPLPNFLLFERFLNPERISMPDFDIDFCQDRRQEVIGYVTKKYGENSVSQIITYGKLQARAAIRDVGRVLGMAYSEVDVLSKLMPDKLGITLQEAIELEPRIREMMESDPQIGTLMDLAQRIEGLVRHSGIHAAGVIIADGELVKIAPLYKGADGENVVQYDMKHAEKIGLIKFDFLGLKTLTHIHNALKLIEKNRGKRILSHEISMEDKAIYELLSRGDSAGIFQFEGGRITEATKSIKPTCFADITAINALYRPGPMDNIPLYSKRKNGLAKIEYLFDELEPLLKETYGVIIYQEQVMMIAAKIASYSLGEADMLRRAMGKKIAAEMELQRTRFLDGAKKNGHDLEKANELFELVAKFAGYGFNKSHAAAYCVVTGQTAWLKSYYPVEFFAALLTTEMGDTDKVVKYVKDAQKRGIKVKAPHINFSEYKFNVQEDTIFFGLGAIKGVGSAAVDAIIEARGNKKKFESLEDFFATVDLRRVNKKVIECLIKAGAFDGFGGHRAQLMAGYAKFIDASESKRKDEAVGQSSLFDLLDEPSDRVKLGDTKPWGKNQVLAYEKEVLGFYLSDHPLKGYDQLAKAWVTGPISDYLNSVVESDPDLDEGGEEVRPANSKRSSQAADRKKVVLVGLVTENRELLTKKGTRMAFAKLEDLSGSIEMVVFPDVFAKYGSVMKGERPLIVTGTLSENSVKTESMVLLEEQLSKLRRIRLNLEILPPENLAPLKELLGQNVGETQIVCALEVEGQEILYQLPTGVRITQGFLEGLQALAPIENILGFD